MPTYDIFTNHDCNLACTYCFEHCKTNRVNSLSDCCDFLESCYRRDFPLKEGVVVELIGGESLLHPELCGGIAQKALELDEEYKAPRPFVMHITTNGTLFDRADVAAFLHAWKDHLAFGFSIDGTKGNHDACRVDRAGRGSYDRAVRGWEMVRSVIPPCRLTVKSTYTHETIGSYSDGVINLVELGFTDIGANGVYEEDWPDGDAELILPHLERVVDFLFDHGLENRVHVFQVNAGDLDLSKGVPMGKSRQNYCGTCTHMRTLGFDRKLYGCHRFATLGEPMPIGELAADGRQVITDAGLMQKAGNMWLKRPKECRECHLGAVCPGCVVAAFEYDREHPERYCGKFRQCGWAVAMTAARMYFRERLGGRERGGNGENQRLRGVSD